MGGGGGRVGGEAGGGGGQPPTFLFFNAFIYTESYNLANGQFLLYTSYNMIFKIYS